MARSARQSVRPRPSPVLSKGLFAALARYMPIYLIDRLVAESGHVYRDRLYTPWVSLWGMIYQALADNGSDWFITGATDSRWNDTDLNQLKTVPGSAFEVVASGPIIR